MPAWLEQRKHLNETTCVDLEKLERVTCSSVLRHSSNYAESPVSPLLEVIQEIDVFHQLMALYPDRIAPAYRFADIERNRQSGKISGLLTIEDLGCCFGGLAALHLHPVGGSDDDADLEL